MKVVRRFTYRTENVIIVCNQITCSLPRGSKLYGISSFTHLVEGLTRSFTDRLNFYCTISDVGGSKGLHHLISDHNDSVTESPRSDNEACLSAVSGESGCISSSESACTTRNVLRDVLDGVVEPELLDNCVEDLQILTEHSGTAMCELLDKAEELRNLREIQAEAKVMDEKMLSAIAASSKSSANDPESMLAVP